MRAEIAGSVKKSRQLEESPKVLNKNKGKKETPIKKAHFKYNEEMLQKHSNIISPVGKPPLSTRHKEPVPIKARENRTSSRSSINERMQGITEKRRVMKTSIGLR